MTLNVNGTHRARSEEPKDLVFVTIRQRNAVSRREDNTDSWGIDEIDSKEECKLVLRDVNAMVRCFIKAIDYNKSCLIVNPLKI